MDKCPFEEKPNVNAEVTWVKPNLVCEVTFTEWTKNGYMRHPSFQRLRDDKKPKDVLVKNEMGTGIQP